MPIILTAVTTFKDEDEFVKHFMTIIDAGLITIREYLVLVTDKTLQQGSIKYYIEKLEEN